MNVNSALSMGRTSYSISKLSGQNSAFANISNMSSMDVLYSTRTTAKSMNLLYKNFYAKDKDEAASDALDSTFTKYTNKTNQFYTKFTPAMNNLKESSAAVTDAMSEKSTATTDEITAKIKSFAADYTTAAKTLRDNSNVSTSVSSMASSFSSMKYMNKSLSEIGISVNSAGGMTVDEGKLSESLTNNMDKVKSLLGGKSGVAALANTKAAAALNNSANLISYTDFTSTLSKTVGLSGTDSRYYKGLLMDLYA